MSDTKDPTSELPGDLPAISRRTILKQGAALGAFAVAGRSVLGTRSRSSLPASKASAPRADGLVIKAVKDESPRRFEFRGQCQVIGNVWSDACFAGMVAAGKDMNLHVVTGGPMTVDPVSQVAEIESWIIEKVDCIMVSAADPDALTPIINKAVKAGIVVVTFDSDAPYSKRHVFDVQCSSRVVADYQIDTLAREMHSKGQWAYIGGELTQIEKQLQFSYMKARAKSLYPKMEFMAAEYCADNTQLAANQASELIVRFPNLGGLVSNSGSGCIGAAEGTEASHKAKIVKVTGTPLPSTAATYVRDGTMPECFFWNTRHQGYRAAALGYKLLTGKDIHDNTSLRLWTGMAPLVQLEVNPFNSKNLDAILGPPGIINTHNINQWVPID